MVFASSLPCVFAEKQQVGPLFADLVKTKRRERDSFVCGERSAGYYLLFLVVIAVM